MGVPGPTTTAAPVELSTLQLSYGLGLEVTRKFMSERLTFSLPGGRRVELDGMFAPRCKERLYQPLIDQLRG